MAPLIPLVEPHRRSLRPDITPLVDCVFLLLVFFLLTSSFSRERSLELGTINSGIAPDPQGSSLEILIAANGGITIDGENVSATLLAERLVRKHEADPLTRIRLVPDKKAPAGQVLVVLDVAKTAGYESIDVIGRKEPVEEGEP